jgi:hypothetical protein
MLTLVINIQVYKQGSFRDITLRKRVNSIYLAQCIPHLNKIGKVRIKWPCGAFA